MTDARPTVRRRLALGLLATAVLLTSCGSEKVVPIGYAVVGDRVIALQVLAGVGDSATAKVTDQSASAVVVEVQLKRAKDTHPDVEVTLRTEVSLSEPLGSRVVRDASGAEIPQR